MANLKELKKQERHPFSPKTIKGKTDAVQNERKKERSETNGSKKESKTLTV